MSECLLLVECNTDALAAGELGESAIAAGGPGDFSDERIEELRLRPGPIYVLPDAGSLGGEAPRRWVFDLYPKALLCPPEYGEGLEDLAQVLHKRGKGAARKVLESLKARAVDALELELREAGTSSTEGSQSLAAYRHAKERILPLVARLEDEGERDAALHDVASKLKLSIKPLRKTLSSLLVQGSEPEIDETEQKTPHLNPARLGTSMRWNYSGPSAFSVGRRRT